MAEAHSSLLAKTASANTDVRGTHPKAARDGEANPVPSRPKPWTVPARGLVVFHGPGKTARLSHYFLPRLLLQGKRVLLLDGANSADPRLMARLGLSAAGAVRASLVHYNTAAEIARFGAALREVIDNPHES